MLVPIVDHAPRIAGIGVAALHFPMRGAAARLFKAPHLRPFFVSPVVAVCWRKLIHVAKTASSFAWFRRATPRNKGVSETAVSGASVFSEALASRPPIAGLPWLSSRRCSPHAPAAITG
jgi:hypothetical protein